MWRALRRTAWTKNGRAVFQIACLLFGAALATHRPSLYAAAALLASLVVVAILGAAFAWSRLEATWECPSRVHADEVFPLRMRLRNRGFLAVCGVEIREPGKRKGPPAVVSGLLRPGADLPIDVGGRLRRRGLQWLEAPLLTIRWPFMLAAAEGALGEDREVLAFPRRIPVPGHLLRSPAAESAAEETAAAAQRGGDHFRGVRDWVPGDAPRAIAWRSSARHGRLLSREFEREDTGRAVVLLDADVRDLAPSNRAAALERACSLAASLLLRLRTEGRRVTFAAFTPDPVVVRSLSTARGLGRALEALALLAPPDRRDPRRDPLALLPARDLRGARVLLVKAALGSPRSVRGPRGVEIRVVPSLRAVFEPGVRR